MPSADKSRLLARLLSRLAGPARKAADPVPVDDAHTEPRSDAGPDIFHGDAVLAEFVRSFLLWECTTPKAELALKRLASQVVDINEFRISLPSEMASIIGPGYPMVEDRVIFLRAALNDLFKREHRLKMHHLPGMPKKTALTYLQTLDKTPPFVADRVALVCCSAHALPIDSRVAEVLKKAKVFEQEADPATVGSLAARLVKAGEARNAYDLLQQAADTLTLATARTPRPSRAVSKPRKPAAKKATPKASRRAKERN